MDKLPKEKADQKQIEQLLKNNPQFKDPDFLKQLDKMSKSPQFPENLEGKLPTNVTAADHREQTKSYEENRQTGHRVGPATQWGSRAARRSRRST